MNITTEWVLEYLKTNGTKFIIPKYATKIEEGAFSNVFGYGTELSELEIEIIFEDDSALQEIEKGAFKTCNIINEVIVPKSVKEVGDMAFYSCGRNAFLEEGTEIRKRRRNFLCVF